MNIVGKDNETRVEVKQSKIQGTGLFALKNFKKGEKIYSYPKGRILTGLEIEKLSSKEKDHLDKIAHDQYEIIEPPACCVNHSCNPNIKERNRMAYALRDIRRGEELTIDYDKIAQIDNPFKCYCGSENCRGVVVGRKIATAS